MTQVDAVHILLVEDQALIALSEKSMLEQHGFRVTIAGSGDRAVALAEQTPDVALILMDIDLGDGIDGTVAARRILGSRSVPIVFLSAHTEEEIVAKTDDVVSYGYIDKGSGTYVLVATIRMALKLYDADRTIAEQRVNLLATKNAAPVGMFVVDDEMRVSLANRSAGEIAGVSEPELIGMRCGDMLGCVNRAAEGALCGETPACTACSLYRDVRATLTSGTSVVQREKEFDLDVPGADGVAARRVWLRYSTSHVTLSRRNAVLVTIKDITTERETQERIRVLSKVADSNGTIVIVTDAERRTTWVNDNFQRLTGYSLADVLGRSPGRVLRGDDPDTRVNDRLVRALDAGEPYQGEFLNYSRDGQPFWISMDIQPVHDAEGTLTHYVAIGTDATDRRERETRGKLRSVRTRQIMDIGQEGVMVIDSNRRVVYANRAYSVLTGYEMSQILGRTADEVFERVHPEEAPTLRAQAYEAIERGDTELVYSCRYLTRVGRYRWRRDHVFVFYDSDGRLDEAWILARDLTDSNPGVYEFRVVENARQQDHPRVGGD